MVLQHTVCGLYLLFENLILIETSVYIGVGANQNLAHLQQLWKSQNGACTQRLFTSKP